MRVALGRLGDGTVGLRIAKAGFDANANPPPAPANLIFDSNWPQLLPIHQSGVLVVGGGSSASVSVPKLGYIPLFSYMLKPSGQSWLKNPQYASQYYKNNQAVQSAVSYIQVYVMDGSFNVSCFTQGNDQSWPQSFSVGYVIYKVAG